MSSRRSPTRIEYKTIRVDMEVFKYLQQLARPFTDSPNDVLRQLLNMTDNKVRPEPVEAAPEV